MKNKSNQVVKIQKTISLLLLVGCFNVSAQTTNTLTNTNTPTQTKTMNYTLTFDDSQKTIANPAEADIRAAVTAHKDDFGPVFQISPDDKKESLQIDAQGDSHFAFDYTRDEKGGYISKRENFSIEEAVKILTAYRNGSADWMKLVDWKELKP
jgi:hypothetical protein